MFQILDNFFSTFQCRKVTHECYASILKRSWGGGGTWKNCILDGGDYWWPSFTSYHLVGHLGFQPLPEITKMVIITHRVNMETKKQKLNPH